MDWPLLWPLGLGTHNTRCSVHPLTFSLNSAPFTEIISLRRRKHDVIFVSLGRLPGVSHVRLLHGDFVGCALLEEESIPHLIDWRTGAKYPLTGLPTPYVSCVVSLNGCE
jgi:hypothetical protein